MKPDLVDELQCPTCHGPLTLQKFTYFKELGSFPFSLLHCMLPDQLVAPATRYCGRNEFRCYFERAGLTGVETASRQRLARHQLGAESTGSG